MTVRLSRCGHLGCADAGSAEKRFPCRRARSWEKVCVVVWRIQVRVAASPTV